MKTRLTKSTRRLHQDRQDDQPLGSDISTELVVEEDDWKTGREGLVSRREEKAIGKRETKRRDASSPSSVGFAILLYNSARCLEKL